MDVDTDLTHIVEKKARAKRNPFNSHQTNDDEPNGFVILN